MDNIMASYLKPRRGYYSAISSTTLQSGEVFFETPNGIRGGKGRIMMGNGSNNYANLISNSLYFMRHQWETLSVSQNITAINDNNATIVLSNHAGLKNATEVVVNFSQSRVGQLVFCKIQPKLHIRYIHILVEAIDYVFMVI